jgi:hypothetical protein
LLLRSRDLEVAMIEFDCPQCGEPMEVKNKMAGRKVRCVECDRLVRVPDDDDDYDDDDDFDSRSSRGRQRDEGLSGLELLLYGALCLAVPGVNVLVTSMLYYLWQSSQPKRASQINTLGFVIFGIHAVIICVIVMIRAANK